MIKSVGSLSEVSRAPAQPSPAQYQGQVESREQLSCCIWRSDSWRHHHVTFIIYFISIFRPSCDELMSGCFSFLITSDWIVKVQGSSSGLQCLDPVTRQLVICPKKFGSLSRLTGKLQRASQWSGHHNYVYLPPLVHCSLCSLLGSTKRDVLPRNNCTGWG